MGDLLGVEPMLAIGGLAIIAALHFRNVKGSIIIGVLVTALGYFAINSSWPTRSGCRPVGVGLNLTMGERQKPPSKSSTATTASELRVVFGHVCCAAHAHGCPDMAVAG